VRAEISTDQTPNFIDDVLGGGIVFTVRTRTGTVVSSQPFLANECGRVGAGGGSIRCKNASRSQAKFQKHPSPGFFTLTIATRSQSVALPAVPGDLPLAVVVTSPISIDRVGPIPGPTGSCVQTGDAAVTCKN
jgi:hypothetical protein